MKFNPYNEIKHVYILNKEEFAEFNNHIKEYFGLKDIKDIHIFCNDGSIEADITCYEFHNNGGMKL